MTCKYFLAVPVAFVLALPGCSDETPVEEDRTDTESVQATDSKQATDSIKPTVAEIVALRDKIRDGFAAGDIDAAHGPLHEVGSKLEQLSGLVAESNLSQDDRQAVEGHIETLFDAFGEVDKTLHGQDGATYDEVATTIDETLKKLVDACQ